MDIYRERAHLVAHLARLYPSVLSYSDPAEPEWPVLYVDTPEGQMSWHISRSDLDLFEHVALVPADDSRALWDGHTTDNKYARLARLRGCPTLTALRSGLITPTQVAAWENGAG